MLPTERPGQSVWVYLDEGLKLAHQLLFTLVRTGQSLLEAGLEVVPVKRHQVCTWSFWGAGSLGKEVSSVGKTASVGRAASVVVTVTVTICLMAGLNEAQWLRRLAVSRAWQFALVAQIHLGLLGLAPRGLGRDGGFLAL